MGMRFRGILTGALLAMLPVAAQAEGPIPPERFVVERGVDFYGGDIRAVFDTTQENCAAVCLREEDCVAYTFNAAQGACFPKSSIGERTPFEAAFSGRLVETPRATVDRGAAIAADLDALRPADFRAARQLAEAVGRRYPVGQGESAATLVEAALAAQDSPAAAEALQGRIVALTDAPDAWLDLGRTYRARTEDDWEYRQRAVAATLNGVLRAGDPALRATALDQLAEMLEHDGRGRTGIDMLKASLALAPRRTTRERLAGLRARAGFRILSHDVDSDAAAPRACITFSEPVSGTVDPEPYVRVTGRDLPVEASDSRICVDGLEHGSRYEIVLRSGLPAAAAGEALAQDERIDVYVRDRAPAVRFSGRSYVLPKTGTAALPITTVNLDTVSLRIHRVDDRNILRSIQERFFTRNLDAYAENDLRDQLGTMVWEGVGEVERRLNEDVVTRLPLAEAIGDFEPGVYVATARAPEGTQDWEEAATQWFVVTDLGLTTTLADDGLHVFVNGLSDARAREGTALTLLARNNEVLGEAVTDADGYAVFAPGLTRGTRGLAPALLTAGRGAGDFAFLDLTAPGFDLSDRGVEGRAAPGPVDVFATTERGAYRPGETVHATILARDARADAVTDLPLTVVVERPDGVEHLRRTVRDAGAGGRTVDVGLADTAMRGTWTMRVHADPEAAALARLSFLVEDFLPQRIEIDLTAPEGPVSLADTPAIRVDAAYLYGAPAAALPVEGEALVRAVRGLDAYPGYVFGLADEERDTWLRPLEPGFETDARGRASIPLALPDDVRSSRPLILTARIRVRDGSSRPVERSLDVPLTAERAAIGLRPLFGETVSGGEEARFEAIAVGPDGARIAMAGTVWTLSRLNTRYQWYNLDGRWDYEPITTRERIASGEAAIAADAPTTVAAPVDWGRYELRIASKDDPAIATTTRFTAGWYAPVAGSGTPDTLQVSLDADAYAIGDTATLRVEARHGGEVLVQVLGGGLIASARETVDAGTSEIALPVTEAWGAGAYVVATLLRPMDVAAGRNPARAMGLAWMPVDPGDRALDVAFLAGDEAAPRGPLDGSVRIAGLAAGTEAFVTVAAVDVGVLNVTGFDFPEVEDHYFGQRALGAELRDVYGRLIDGLDGAMGQVRSGGGALGGGAAPPPIEDLVALFSGVVATDADGVARVAFDLPDFNGTVRLMATAWTDGAVGSAEKDVLVRDPVVVSVSAPRFLAPGDESRVLVELAHAFGPAGEVRVVLEGDAELTLGEADRTVTLAEKGQARLSVPVTARTVGDPDIRLVTTTPDGKRLTKTVRLPVRANDPVVARRSRLPLAAGGTATVGEDTFAGLMPGTGRATLVVGPLANFDVAGALQGLDLYPYGCTEQTASRALPLLYHGAVARDLGLAPDGGVEARVTDAIRRVLANQTGGGSFGLWRPSDGDFWLDAYVTDFLSRAREAGHAVPDGAFDAALSNLRNRVSYAGDFDEGGEALAYALMVLAREGTAAIGDLRYYADARGTAFATPLAKAQLGAALALYGEQRRADAMFALAGAETGERRPGWRDDYGTALRDTAGVLALAVEAGSKAVDAEALTRRIADGFAAKDHTSTQEKVWTLLAANALLNDAAVASVTLDGAPLDRSVVDIRSGRTATLANTGGEAVDAVLTVFGVPTEPEPASGNGYAIARTYYTMDGDAVSPEAVARDTRLVAVLDVTVERGAQARLIVDDALPAGFEIDNPALLRAGDIATLDWLPETARAEHAEFRSDRFVAAVTARNDFSLAYIVRAISPGTFRHPAALVEDMYRPEFRARTAAGSVTVTAE